MKALSIRQPWAWLIVHGHKTIENRTWRTKFRGPVLIHTGHALDKEGYRLAEYIACCQGIVLPPLRVMDRGGIVGRATITDCVTALDSPWFFGPYGFVLRDAEPLPFRKMPGQLGFFNVEEEG